MKAAVLHEIGGTPRYEDFPDPEAGEGEVVVEMKAVAVENLDREIAAGRHFSGHGLAAALPAIPCCDGVGTVPDGTLVGFSQPRLPYGALAEHTVVPVTHVSPAPEGVDPAEAVVLASALTGFAARTAAGLEPGQTVLVQGATGVAGRLAVQVVRKLGAGRVVATGRRDEALREVAELGADATVNTTESDEDLVAAYADEAQDGYDVVLDFLWGRPTEMLLRALTPEKLAFAKPIRLVQIGSSANESITLDAAAVRTSGVEIYGSTKGLSPETMGAAYEQVLQWARADELTFSIECAPLSQIESIWQRTDIAGKRLVIVPG